MSILDFFALSANAPAQIALTGLAVLVVLELITMLAGLSASNMIDDVVDIHDVDIDPDVEVSSFETALSWLGLGKVPFMVWLAGHLTITALVALLFSFFCLALNLTPSPWLSWPLSQVGALVGNHYLCRALAGMVPKETSTAVHPETFVGRRAHLIGGTSRPNMPAQARMTDQHGRVHYVLVKPYNTEAIPNDTWVILMTREMDGSFTAIEDTQTL